MLFAQYVTDNYTMIFELIGLMVMLEISVHISERMRRLTLVVVILLFAESACFYLERWTQTFSELSLARPLLTAAVYSLYPLILVVVMQIMVTNALSHRKLLLLLIPEIVSVPLYFTSQWTHLVCWFTADNRYQSEVLYLWPYIIFGFYTVVFLIQNLRFFRSHSRKDRTTAAYIIIGPMIGALYYRLLQSDLDYSALFTSAILLYYIFIYIHMAKVDPLTLLLNRQSYYRAMEEGTKTVTGAVSVDMNELKYLNDHFGHQAGDEALKTISGILRENCGRGGTVYRVGGDEFVILYTKTSEQQLAGDIAAMRQKLSETPYTCAFGHAMVTDGGRIYDAVVEADGRMYADKAAIKQEMRQRGEQFHDRQ